MASYLEANPSSPTSGSFSQTQKLEPVALGLTLPWTRIEQDEERFKKILIACVVLILLLLLILTFSPVADRVKTNDKVVAKTKVLLEPIEFKEPEPVAPPPPKPKPKEQPKVAEQKSQAKSSKPAPETSQEPVSAGLSEVSSQLSALRQSFDLKRNQNKNLSVSEAGKKEVTSRTVLGKETATKLSDGIDINSDVMLDERTTLAAHNASAVEGIDQGGVEGGNPTSRYSTHISGERTMESVRFTLEKNKASVFSLYYQALNHNPNMSGKMTFKLRIEPSGDISDVKLISSELGDRSLNDAILARIRQIKFREEDVKVANVTYTFHFIES